MADGTITIDLDFPHNKANFKSDVEATKELLKDVGKDTGKNINSEFSKSTNKLLHEARDAKNKTNEELDGIKSKVTTKLEAKSDKSKVDQYKRELGKLPKQIYTDIKANDRTGGTLMRIKSHFSQINKEGKKTHSLFKTIFSANILSNAVTGTFGAIKNAMGGVISEAKQYALAQQTMNATWLTLTGNAKKGKQMVDQINEMAAAAQNSTEMVDQLSQKFYAINNNAKQTGELTKAVLTLQDAFGQSDSAVENFGTQFAQMMANGKVSAQDMMSIVNTFPKLKPMLLDYERQIHHSKNMTMGQLSDLISQGKVKSQDMINVVLRAGQKFKDATGNFTATIPGMIRTVHSQIPRFLQAFEGPLVKAQNPLYKAISNWVTDKSTTKEFSKLGDTVSKGMDTVMKGLTGGKTVNVTKMLNDALEHINQSLKSIFSWLGAHAKDLGRIARDLSSIVFQLGKSIWKTASDIIINIAQDFGLINKHSSKSKDNLHQIADALDNFSKNKEAIQIIAKALIAMVAIKGFMGVVNGLNSIVDGAKRAKANISDLNASLQSMSTGQKVGAGAMTGVAVGSMDAIDAVQHMHNADRRSKDIGGGVGAVAGGELTAMIPYVGPALATLGATLGKWLGEMAGDNINKFTKGWQSKKPPKNFWSFENFGWSTHDMMTKSLKMFINFFKDIGKQLNAFGKWWNKFWNGVGKSWNKWVNGIIKYVKSNWKQLALLLINPFVGWIALLYKHNKKFRKWVNGIIKAVRKSFNDLGKWWRSFAKNLVKSWNSFWNNLFKLISRWYRNITKLWREFINYISDHWNAFVKWLRRNWDAFWNYLANKFSSWNRGIQRGFRSFASGVANIWRGVSRTVRNIVQDMINGVIRTINFGIGAIDGVIHAFGGSSNAISKLSYVHFANGTKSIDRPTLAMVNDGNDSPATGNKEALFRPRTGEFGIFQGRNQLTMLEAGDEIINAKDTADIMRGYGITHFAGGTDWLGKVGGFISGIWNGISGTAKKLISWFKQAKEFIAHPIQSVENIFAYRNGGIRGVFAELGRDAFDTVKGNVKDWWSELWGAVKDKFDGNDLKNNRLLNLAKSEVGGGFWKFIDKLTDLFADNIKNPGGSGVERWRPIVKRALAKNGLPTTSDYVDAWLRQINTESGGNPHAIQGNIGDSNNVTGDLAKGLVQTISATFEANAFPRHHDIFNGYDDLLAGIRYALNKYGRSGMLNVIGHGHGYQNGGEGNQEGWYKLFEGNNKEFVIPTATSINRTYEMIGRSAVYAGMKDGVYTQTNSDSQLLQDISFKLDRLLDVNSNQLNAMNNPIPAVVSQQDIYDNYNKLRNIKQRYDQFFN